MPDVPGRDKLERKLARDVSLALSGGFTALVKLLSDLPTLDSNLTAFFTELGASLRKVISPTLQQIYLSQAEVLSTQLTIGVDWGLINQAAANWATTYTFDLVRGINETTRQILQNAINTYYREGLTIDELKQLLEPTFGPVRADMIAVTEVTRASAQGELALARQIEKENPNIRMVDVWATNNDERVCIICFPRNGKDQGDGWEDPPPGHPRCRCWLNHRMEVL